MRLTQGSFTFISLLLAGRAASAQHHHHHHHGDHRDDAVSSAPLASMDQAEEARSRGDHVAALGFAEAVARQAATPAVQLFVAQELAALGRHADALVAAEACVEAVGRDRAIHHRRRLLEDCGALATEARARVAFVRLVVPPSAPAGLSVVVNGIVVERARWGSGYAVAPGNVAVETNGAGTTEFRAVVVTNAAQTVDVNVVLSPPAAPVAVVPTPAAEIPLVVAPDLVAPVTEGPTPAVEPSAEPEPSRFAIEVGGGLGVGLILGNPQVVTASSGFYAEGTYSLTASGAALRACRAGYQCPAVTGATASPTGVLVASLRWSPLRDPLGRRFALGVTLRWQPDSAGDAFNALVLGARLYFVLTPRGFARRGVTLAALAGLGYGDIQSVPAGQAASGSVAHVSSGPVDINAGLRVEVGFAGFLHAAIDVVGHAMLPAQSAAVDVVGLLGAHY